MRRFNVYLAARYDRREEMFGIAELMDERVPLCTAACEWVTGIHDYAPPQLCAEVDLREIRNCDALVLFCEEDRYRYNSGGRHVEVGYALAFKKLVIVVGTPENIFHQLPEVIRVPDWQGAFQVLNDWSEKCLTEER